MQQLIVGVMSTIILLLTTLGVLEQGQDMPEITAHLCGNAYNFLCLGAFSCWHHLCCDAAYSAVWRGDPLPSLPLARKSLMCGIHQLE